VCGTSIMPDPTLSRYTPRQIADAIVCVVLDEYAEQKELSAKHDALALSNAVLEIMASMGVTFVDGTSDYWGGK
jgi:hypothetical protein